MLHQRFRGVLQDDGRSRVGSWVHNGTNVFQRNILLFSGVLLQKILIHLYVAVVISARPLKAVELHRNLVDVIL